MSNQSVIDKLVKSSSVHAEWIKPLSNALQSVDPAYLQTLTQDTHWLPGPEKLFAAFQRDLSGCQYILFGESPYPRQASANGIAFYDAAVTDLWSDTGLSKAVNKATSLRNIMKSALLAEELIKPDNEGKISQISIANLDKQALIQTIEQLFSALQQKGFLLLNATPVLYPERKPTIEARYWSDFIEQLLIEINKHKKSLPTLILWGKIARQIEGLTVAEQYPKISSEHPYNLSFITNEVIQNLFSELKFLQK